MGIVADTSVYTNTPGPNAAEGLETLRQNQLALMEQVGLLPPQDLSIADGVISPTRGSVVVDTEGGAAADDLTVINPTLSDQTTLHDGMIVELIAKDDARAITVKHGTGQNNIFLVEQADIVLSTKWSLRLQWDAQGQIWRQRLFASPLHTATTSQAGIVKIGPNLYINNGTLSGPTPDNNYFQVTDAHVLTLAEALKQELAEFERLRKLKIGCPMYWRSSTLPEGYAWANGDFVEFADWPELEEVYSSGGFAGLLLPWDADEEEQAANLGKFRPDSANPTGLYLPSYGGQFFRACSSAQSAGTKNEAGAPEISASLAASGAVAWSTPGGAFVFRTGSASSPVAVSDLTSGSISKTDLEFYASKSNSTYGRNNTIMPDSINLSVIVYLGK